MSGTRNYISSRMSTLTREISNCTATVRGEQITQEDIDLKNSILNMNGLCEYCEKNPATKGDHFFPLVRGKFPTDACSDFWNLVPSCGACNSSKRGCTLKEWLVQKSAGNPFHKMDPDTLSRVTTKLTNFEQHSEQRRYRKMFENEADVAALIAYLSDTLDKAQTITRNIHNTTKYHRRNN